MKRFAILAALVLAGGLAVPAKAQIHLNEIYASHSGTDTQEFVEVYGPAGSSLDGIAVVVVEGDGPAAGTVDRIWDLSGFVIPGDVVDGGGNGYFVLGDTAVPTVDLDIGAQDSIENGTETFYLLDVIDLPGLGALLGSDRDTNNDGVYDFPGPGAFGTILDIVAMVDSGFGAGDQVYDDPIIRGPDGTFFPAGIYRLFDYPGNWAKNFLDFDVSANINKQRTPGAPNVPEPTSLVLLAIGGVLLGRRRPMA